MSLIESIMDEKLSIGPLTDEDGNILWFQNGCFHRTDGPAISCPNGDQYWYQNGELHREDGPARVYSSGSNEYWLNGIQYDPITFLVRYYERTN
jgi:hypothetical protein